MSSFEVSIELSSGKDINNRLRECDVELSVCVCVFVSAELEQQPI